MDDMLKKAEQKTGVNSNDIKKLAQSVNSMDLTNEKDIRRLVKQVAKVANKPVSKRTEDMIVDTLTKKKGKIDPSTIKKMM
ncbi:stage VI sporulation protein F [Lentibacillus cibarius]|uniref:Stage VI sporulation protein F n=1 Tax=Lentibacillus cibarius TaxID=2583219 RepID=A0A549YJY2_9BACI|nr:stage VI sporulation protein F [Lentibacillus cibarius]TMN23386.1 stage VI sporulation protein F [Lentibacillus cibarius]TRM12195.1 stage VI sporulation protein F [Lentibacillus cibarius]